MNTRKKSIIKVCSIKGCERKVISVGFCKNHYIAYCKYGDPLHCIFDKISFTDPENVKKCLVNHRTISENNCWEWTKGRTSLGYGMKQIDGSLKLVHRISAVVFMGFKIESNLCVLHKCDNPPCFNPEHLFIGTKKDNSLDMKSKGKSVFGEKNKGSKLKESDVWDIIDLLGNGVIHKKIAEKYNVTKFTVSRINRRITWRHLWDE